MRRLLTLVLLIIIALGLVSCDEDGELRIRNRSNSDVWISVDGAGLQQMGAWTNWSQYYSEDSQVSIDYSGNHVFANTMTGEVRKGLVTTVDIEADAGAVKIVNDSTFVITEVYISPSDQTEWGENDLVGTIVPGAQALWTISPGQWDLKLVDGVQNVYYKYDQTMELDQTLELLCSSFGVKQNGHKGAVPFILSHKQKLERKF